MGGTRLGPSGLASTTAGSGNGVHTPVKRQRPLAPLGVSTGSLGLGWLAGQPGGAGGACVAIGSLREGGACRGRVQKRVGSWALAHRRQKALSGTRSEWAPRAVHDGRKAVGSWASGVTGQEALWGSRAELAPGQLATAESRWVLGLGITGRTRSQELARNGTRGSSRLQKASGLGSWDRRPDTISGSLRGIAARGSSRRRKPGLGVGQRQTGGTLMSWRGIGAWVRSRWRDQEDFGADREVAGAQEGSQA